MMKLLNGVVKEEYLNRIKIGAGSTVLEQKEAERPPCILTCRKLGYLQAPKRKSAGPLHKIHCQNFLEVIQQRKKKRNVAK